MRQEHRPDAAEYGIRFGCGALIGAILGALLLGELVVQSNLGWGGAALLGAVVCGTCAAVTGDRFWRKFGE